MADGVQPDLVLILLGGNDWNKHIKDQYEPGRERWQPLPLRSTALLSLLDGLVITPLRRQITGKSWSDVTKTIGRPEDLNGDRRMFGERSPLHRFRPQAVSAGYAADLEALVHCARSQSVRASSLPSPMPMARRLLTRSSSRISG